MSDIEIRAFHALIKEQDGQIESIEDDLSKESELCSKLLKVVSKIAGMDEFTKEFIGVGGSREELEVCTSFLEHCN